MRRRVVARAPASSANLGPGFDVLAAAIDLWVEVEVVETGRFAVLTDLPVARNRRNVAVRAFERLFDPSGCEFRIRSEVPLSGGLGSSAAAAVCALLCAQALAGEQADVLAEATAFEGHPDNAAAALLGGFVVCAGTRAERVEPPPGLAAFAVVPHEAVRTREARAALPRRVPLADAAFNVGQASLLVLGLARGDLRLVAEGLGDRLHQPHRAHLFPRSAALLDRARDLGALGATVSGAGPTVLVWCTTKDAGRVAGRLREEADGWADVLEAPFALRGAQVDAVAV